MRNAALCLALIAACAPWASPDARATVLADGLRTAADEMNAVENVADFPLRRCGPHRCGWHHRYRGCPDRLSCMPLYGAYGPWGGRGYWGSFSYPWAR
jgi:hypothetical protein